MLCVLYHVVCCVCGAGEGGGHSESSEQAVLPSRPSLPLLQASSLPSTVVENLSFSDGQTEKNGISSLTNVIPIYPLGLEGRLTVCISAPFCLYTIQ